MVHPGNAFAAKLSTTLAIFIMSPGESLPVLQWNAGGLCQPKRVNFLEDYLLKQDASISQRSRNAIPFDNIKPLIKKKILRTSS